MTDQDGLTGRTQESGGHYHNGSWYTDEECGCSLSVSNELTQEVIDATWLLAPLGPVCAYWDEEDAPICGHPSCYTILTEQDRAVGVPARQAMERRALLNAILDIPFFRRGLGPFDPDDITIYDDGTWTYSGVFGRTDGTWLITGDLFDITIGRTERYW